MNIKTKISKGLMGLTLIASLGACKTATIGGVEIICKTPYSTYPTSHPCYEPSTSRDSSGSGFSPEREGYRGRGERDHDRSGGHGGHHEGC